MTSKKHLIIPGLNQAPALFDFLELEKNSIQLLQLPYNKKNKELFHNTLFKDYDRYFNEFKEDEFENVFAHSLGSLLFLINISKLKFKNAFLIAPPFDSVKPLQLFFTFLPDNMKVPSLNLKSRRIHSYCLVKHYKQIIELQNELKSNIVLNDRVSVVYDPRDEMVRSSSMFKYYQYHEYYSRDFPRHLCLDFIEKMIKNN